MFAHAIPRYPKDGRAIPSRHGPTGRLKWQAAVAPTQLLPRNSEAANRKGEPGRMTPFMGSHQNRLDAKGRVSVPAPFRAVLKSRPDGHAPATSHTGANGNGTNGTHLVLRPSHQHPCIEAWPAADFDALAAPLNQLALFSEAQDDLALSLYADAFAAETDREGRIVLPDDLVAFAGLTDQVTFLGAGRIFQIWEPEAAKRRRTEARERARSSGFTLPGAASPQQAPA